MGGEHITQPTATAAAMAALDNGQFVIAHLYDFGEDATADTLIVVEADVFNADGSPANIHLRLDRRAAHPRDLADALAAIRRALPDELGPAQRRQACPPTTNVKARVFSTQGPLGQITQFNTSTGDDRFSLAAVALSDPQGEFAFAAWTDETQSGGDTGARAVRGRPLKVPTAGF